MTMAGLDRGPDRTRLERHLSPRQKLALLVRILARHGYDDKLAGHVSMRTSTPGVLLVNPLGLFWDEVRAVDLVGVARDGTVVEGHGSINPTALFHHAVHNCRPDIEVLAHNHPPYGTVWAAAREIPPLLDQTGANGGGKVVRYADYTGALLDESRAAELASAYGDGDIALLDQHGVLVSGDSPELVLVRALSFEWRCRLAYRVQAMGRLGEPLSAQAERELAETAGVYGTLLLEGYARRVIADDPHVLDE